MLQPCSCQLAKKPNKAQYILQNPQKSASIRPYPALSLSCTLMYLSKTASSAVARGKRLL
jgi:hypothetical protein